MIRCFAEAGIWSGDTIVLDADESTHLYTVMRCREGDRVTALDGAGREAACEIAAIGKKETTLRVLDVHTAQPPALRIGLAQSLVKSQSMDWIIQKAVELGVGLFIPIEAERSVVRFRKDERVKKRERWERIARGALKQSGTLWLPEILTPMSLADYLAQKPAAVLHCSLLEGAKPLSDGVESAFRRNESRVDVLIGPEGDFSPEESAAMAEAGAVPVTLGDVVLRAETAALYVLSVLRYEISRKL